MDDHFAYISPDERATRGMSALERERYYRELREKEERMSIMDVTDEDIEHVSHVESPKGWAGKPKPQ